MPATAQDDGPSREKGPPGPRRRWAAYRRANWMLAGAGVTLTLAGVSPHSPEVQAIRRALRAVNLAGGIEAEGKEVKRVYTSSGPRSENSAG